MATNPNATQITPPRVPIIDERTGAVSREWYRWFYSLYNFAGSGTGISPVTSGGTGLDTIPTNGQLLIGNGSGYTLNTLGAGVGISVVNDAGTITVANTGVLSFSGGLTGLTPATAATGAITLAGTLIAANGGTGFASYAVGDLLYANTTTTLAKLPDVAIGNALISGGALTAPLWGKIGLTTHVSGVLPIANGGTNGSATPTSFGVAYGTGTAYAFTAAGTAKQALLANTGSAPTWSTLTTGASILYGDNAGGFNNVTIGTGVSFAGGTLSATGSGGTVTSVTGTAPVVSSGGTTPAISMPAATTSIDGYLSSTNWNTFNNKQTALVSGTNIKTVGGVTLLGAGDVSAPSFTTVTTSSTTDATTPNTGTTGGFRLRGNATSGIAYLQVTNSTAASEWGYASIVASGLWSWSGAFTATTITASTQFSGAGTGLTGTAAGLSVGGNAATATALQTARTIGGVSFNGTADINLPGVNTTGNQNTSGNAATATNVAGSGITGSRGIPKAAMPAGTVLQVISATYSTQVSTSSSTYADTGLTATITPTASTSTILVIVSQSNVAKDTNNTGANIRLLRGASALSTAAIIAAYNNLITPNNVGSVSLNYLDSPATTSATTYKTQVASNSNNATCYVQTNGSTSYITLMEIAA